MDAAAQLEALLTSVRRRILAHILVHQTIYASCFGLAALIVLLLVGTQILNWYWPLLLFAVVLAISAYRFRNRAPSLYETAQRVDRKLSLFDALSTAYHFRTSSDGIAADQRAATVSLLPSLDIPAAVPLSMPRSAYPAAIMALVAATMLIARYGMTNSMSLERPLVSGVLEMFKPSVAKQLAKFKQNNPLLAKELEKLGISLDGDEKDQDKTAEDKLPDNLLSSPDIPDVNDLTGGRDAVGKSAEVEKDMPPEPGEAGAEKGDQAASKDAKDGGNSDGDNGAKQQKGANAPPKPSNANAQNQGNSDSSLMDKMKDALSKMMDKLKSANKDGEQQQQAQAQKGQKDGQKGDKGGEQKGSKSNQKGEQQGEQSGEGEKGQEAQGEGADKASSDAQASPDAKSGVGKSDGNKDARYAEQLDAMGKISEIMGKRAENIKGDIMVEVSSGKQQLKTQYSQSGATHASTGGEIHRDEVPIEHQAYVQKYFDEVRKADNAAAAKKN